MVDLDTRYHEILTSILQSELAGKKVRVLLFGSRANRTARPSSDIDLALDTEDDIHVEASRIRDAFVESTIPFEVDVVVELRDADEELKKTVRNETIASCDTRS